MSETVKIPSRDEIPREYTWDLSKLFANDDAWEEGYNEFETMIPKIETFKGTLGESPKHLLKCLNFMRDLEQLEERLGYYAHLRSCEDGSDSARQKRLAQYMQSASKAHALASYQTPEIQAIPEETMEEFLAYGGLQEYSVYLEKILRFKPHILSEKEEKLLALQAEANQTPQKTFSSLTDVDFDFGSILTEKGEKPLSHGMFHVYLQDPKKELREKAYIQYYGRYEQHKNTLASLYAGSVHLDIYKARVRNFPSSRAAALFPDKVPEEVYDNLIKTVHDNMTHLHDYYALRKEALNLTSLHHYDVYVPLVQSISVTTPYDDAVNLVIEALTPLGGEYCAILEQGLKGRWVDRYENKGKRSGAFSAGSYSADPYILLNYQDSVLRDVFTLAHEGGHSMHSWYSSANNPFQHYEYTIFEAEVASTFNEQLLADYMLKKADTREMRAYLINKLVDDIIATIYRQTMFAEFEHITHRMVESGIPLTVDSLRTEYRKLLGRYFGSEVMFLDESDLEGLRIPHFYRAFYVYKYATGLSAAVSLARRVLTGGEKEQNDYLAFLRSGGSRYPLESLKLAGVDMSSPVPIQEALAYFKELIHELRDLL